MTKELFAFIFAIFCVFSIQAQEIEGYWTLKSSRPTDKTTSIFNENSSFLSFKQEKFELKISQDSIQLAGKYSMNDKWLHLYPDQLQDSTISYLINKHVGDSLVLSNNKIQYIYTLQNLNKNQRIADSKLTSDSNINTKNVIPNKGFTFQSFWRGILGLFVLILVAYLLSSDRKAIHWKTVIIGLLTQLFLAFGVLKVEFIQQVFNFVGNIFNETLLCTQAGSEFLLGGMMNVDTYGFIFLFQVLPTIIFFSALTSLLFYFGVIQVIVRGMAWVLTKLMTISGPESLSVAGNIFLGQTEAPLMIKVYLSKMTRSEILLVMVGGMATVAGGVLAAYIGFLGGSDEALRLEFARHLLAASVMAAPGAIAISKILCPQKDKIQNTVNVDQDKAGSNVLDAIARGTTEGLKLAANVGAMLLVFIALIALCNQVLAWFGDVTTINTLVAAYTPYDTFSLEAILGVTFAPLMWIIGVAKEDMMLMGQLLGVKLVASEFVGYIQLADLKNPLNPLHLTYSKSVIMATYMLCGFANFASIGIQIGGIGSLADNQRKTLSELGIKALIGGTIASLLSATIAGMIIG